MFSLFRHSCMVHAAAVLSLCLSLSSLHAQAIDTDGDGMPDTWETSMGLNPNDATDAFADKDGDQVPNLWEYSRGTAANNAASKPPPDAIVDSALPSDTNLKRFDSLDAAYESLPTTPNYRSIVRVKRGVYEAFIYYEDPKKVAWLGERGPSRMTGFEGVVIRPHYSAQIFVTDETVFDSLIIEGETYSNLQPTVKVQPDLIYSGQITEVRLVNCIIRNTHPASSLIGEGSVVNNGADLWIVSSTLWNAAVDGNTLGYLGTVENRSGTLHVINSILWDVNATGSALRGAAPSTLQTSIIRNSSFGGINTPPELSSLGYLSANSAACIGAATAIGLATDLQGELRGAQDIGADEWVDTDTDDLPDAWEKFWFGDLSHYPLGDFDYDNVSNEQEFLSGQSPNPDQDGDDLSDAWEVFYFGNIWAHNQHTNPDGDIASNWLEYYYSTNPIVPENDWDDDGLADIGDQDGDGLLNFFERLIGSNPLLADTNGDGIDDSTAFFLGLPFTNGADTDGDGWDDSVELLRGTSPVLADTDGDGWNDKIDFMPLDSLAAFGTYHFPVDLPGAPLITLMNPSSAIQLY